MATKILFVCWGNICRSKAAQGIMTTIIERNDLGNRIVCDSAGVIDVNVGSPPDSRMQRHARQRGYALSGVARQFDSSIDFEEFDYIVTMDEENHADIRALSYLTPEYLSKLHKMVSFCRKTDAKEVPDPYYGGEDGFERVLDILEDACSGFLEDLMEEAI
uniref:Protein-tyrosine phosphatase n=1 Tax=Candidatus Kentrum sp. TUN TaxID=2126343 RepID=A0A450ZEP3_9GAMM|nr:MAG: protein-tyrosine phosphatase [Candidatus Kentron sp. TUN]VFK52453.1 MAG: protein-tyrosine phosphatase [Candidatus Kentron sp. TUN]